MQDRSDSTLSKEDIQQIINNKLDGNEGNKGQSYKEQAHRYYPDYQQAERDKQLIRTVREQVHMPVMASIRLIQDRQEAVYGDGME